MMGKNASGMSSPETTSTGDARCGQGPALMADGLAAVGIERGQEILERGKSPVAPHVALVPPGREAEVPRRRRRNPVR